MSGKVLLWGQPARVYFGSVYYGELENALDWSYEIFKMLNIHVLYFAKNHCRGLLLDFLSSCPVSELICLWILRLMI